MDVELIIDQAPSVFFFFFFLVELALGHSLETWWLYMTPGGNALTH